MKKTTAAYLILLWLMPMAGMAQVDSSRVDSLVSPARPDSLSQTQIDTLQSDSARVLFKVRPWQYHAPLLADTAATDSSLRWQVWPDWTYKKNRDPGVISYRLGTIGRTNAQQIDAHGPKYQQLYWEDIRMNDPVSGLANWSYIPHHKVETLYESDLGTDYRTKFYLKDYYLNKPLTELNYTESSYDTRSLQFVASANVTQKTNVEISYWDRRDGGEYNNSGIVGRQIYGRVTHQLDQQQQLKFKILNNNYDNSLPFGYNISNPATYNFDHFQTSPNEPSGQANRGSTIIGLNYYRRPADSSQTTSKLNAGLFMNTAKRKVTYSADTTSYKVRHLGLNGRKWWQLGPLKLEAAGSAGYFINQNSSTLDTDNWSRLSGEAKSTYAPLSFFELNAHGNYRFRSDGYSDYRLGLDATFKVGPSVQLSTGAALGTRMPTPQQLYWRSGAFVGDENLEKEKIQNMYAKLRYSPFVGSVVGFKGELKQIKNGIRVGADSSFVNGNPYSALSGDAFFNYGSKNFEFSASATYQKFGSFLKSRQTTLPVNEDQRIWFKGSAYVKGYLFDHATYVKGGVAGMLSPKAYSTARYYPSLDYWQFGSEQAIPSFNRLDVDFSARVRSIIILLRYENVLDDVTQQGYFETVGYPMTGRRFIFGIRVLFRD